MTYAERSRQVALDSSIAVMVLLNDDNSDLEFLRVRPVNGSKVIGPEEFSRRKMRCVGVVGLSGCVPRVAFSEPLEPDVVNGIAAAFLSYVCTLLGDSFPRHVEAAEILELERLHALPDKRTN